jgi:uncharacterized membrane protein
VDGDGDEMTHSVPSQVPATKPEPVRLYGAIVSIVLFVAGLVPSITGAWFSTQWWAGVISVVLAVLNYVKDQYLRNQVTPAADVISYVNEDRQVIAGAAAGPVVEGSVVDEGPAAGPVIPE